MLPQERRHHGDIVIVEIAFEFRHLVQLAAVVLLAFLIRSISQVREP